MRCIGLPSFSQNSACTYQPSPVFSFVFLLSYSLTISFQELELQLPCAATAVSLCARPPYKVVVSLEVGPPVLVDLQTSEEQQVPLIGELGRTRRGGVGRGGVGWDEAEWTCRPVKGNKCLS